MENNSVYSASDLANSGEKLFGVKPEIVSAALKIAGVKRTTINEAEKIVKSFLKREV